MMGLLKNIVFSNISIIKMYACFYGKKYKKNKLLSEMIRNVHSIEKGMCLSKPRLGYGIKKIDNVLHFVEDYLNSGYEIRDELKMVCGALEAYVDFHKKNNFYTEQLAKMEEECKSIEAVIGKDIYTKYSGVIEINDLQSNKSSELKDIIMRRHSIRDFSTEIIEDRDIYEAVELANQCPSACNRQTTRIYIADKNVVNGMKDWLVGIGGFAEKVNKFLIVTGRTSAFNAGEAYQYIVNAGIFVGYLSLCLTEKEIGNCVIQRPLLCPPTWIRFAKEWGIPSDEQIVCMVALGKSKKSYKVPVSYRLSVEEIVRKL